MAVKNIVVIDSGNGGRYVYDILIERFPRCNVVLFQDKKNLPYGNKTKNELFTITKENILNFNYFKIDIIVFACNTLSLTIYDDIVKEFPDIKFVKMIPDCFNEKYSNYKSLVLCTCATKRCLNKSNFDKNMNVKIVSFRKLAKRIDDNIYCLYNIKKYLKRSLKKIKINPDIIFIACTHYCYIKSYIQEVYPECHVLKDGIDDLILNVDYIIKKCN